MLSTTSTTASSNPIDALGLQPLTRSLEPHPLRVAIIDEHLLFRQGLRAILSTQPDMTVVADGVDARVLADLVVGLRQR